MTNFKEHLTEDRRLCILRLLKETGGTANDGVLHSALELLGHVRQPRSQIRDDIRFLIDNGLATDEFLGPVQVVTITRRGVEASEGRIDVPGLKKPSIGI